MEYLNKRWTVRGPKDLEKTLRKLPKEVAYLYNELVADLENEGPFPRGWKVLALHSHWKGFLRVVLKRDYRVIYRYESCVISIFIEKIANRKDVYEV